MTNITQVSLLKEVQKPNAPRDTTFIKKDEVKGEAATKVSLSRITETGEFPVNIDKVSELKARIQNGTFKVHSGKIADKILENLKI